jgi:Tfp pilus assembly protein FimT
MPRFARGTTLVEIAITLVVLGVIAAISALRIAPLMERFAVRGASQDVVFALAAARAAATRRGIYVTFIADPRAGRVRVVGAGETIYERDVAVVRGVRLEASRESVTFAPTGLGWGAANTTIVLTRGGRADTITTSRLGRVRRF